VAGLIYALIGLPFALLVWGYLFGGTQLFRIECLAFLPFAPGYVVAGGAVAVVILPIGYGVFCFFMTLIGAWLYNLVAGLVGGVSIGVQVDVSPDVTTG